MSKVILILNALILVVSFVMAWASTNSQVSVLQATARVGHGDRMHASIGSNDPGVAYLRAVQSLEGRLPQATIDQLTVEQWRTIHNAMAEYQETERRGLVKILNSETTAVPDAQRRLSKSALEALQYSLREAIPDEQVVKRIATAVVAHAR